MAVYSTQSVLGTLKNATRQKATNQNYIVRKGPISARAVIQAVAKKEARKRPKKQKVMIPVSSDEDSDSSSDDDEYNSLHL
jgi:hypothetical protein